MSLDCITDVVSRHDVAVHVLLALCTVESSDVNLCDELLAGGALLGRVVLVDTNNDIAK
jgi:hypothetical protein